MRNFKARISKLEKHIKLRKKLYKIYWADGTFVGEYWSVLRWRTISARLKDWALSEAYIPLYIYLARVSGGQWLCSGLTLSATFIYLYV